MFRASQRSSSGDRIVLPYFTAHKTHFFSWKIDVNSTCVLCAEGIISKPTHHVIPVGRVKRPSISNVCEWVKNSWQRVKSETIVKPFKKSGISNTLDGSEDDILYEEIDASIENNHEDDFSGSEDDFMGFCDEQII